jgi:hypothetical protein
VKQEGEFSGSHSSANEFMSVLDGSPCLLVNTNVPKELEALIFRIKQS